MKTKPKIVEFSKCTHCDKQFKYNSERIRHEISHLQNFECNTCSKKFGFISALRRHQKQHERTGSVKCEECDRKFRDDVLLQRHIKYAHKGTFTCSKCSSSFSSEMALGTHMKSHRPVSERRFKCSHRGCGKSFNFSHHLKHHELTHSNVKQHFCGICGKGFIQSHHLKTHLKTHDPSQQLWCEFPECKKKFSSDYAKKRHMATHKNKPDSGISSDSNSWEPPILKSVKNESSESTKGSSVNERTSTDTYNEISFIIVGNSNNATDVINGDVAQIASIDENDNLDVTDNDKRLNNIEDCKMAVGGCIATDDCICEQISGPVAETYHFTPLQNVETNNSLDNNYKEFEEAIIEDDLVKQFETSFKVDLEMDVNENNCEINNIGGVKYKSINACEGCASAGICSETDKANCHKNPTTPMVENRNGVIKLKNSFEIDFKIKKDDFVPLSTCKDVIGNCLVGGDGCLCAKMTVDENQMMAQEIEDIVPQPKD